MYSVILATMLTAGAETTQWGCFRARCHGCHGCGGGCVAYNAFSCSGFCSGCSCSSYCHGCSGCQRIAVVVGCHGCYGCQGGYGSYGCHSSGCYGGSAGSGCSCSGVIMPPAVAAPPQSGGPERVYARPGIVPGVGPLNEAERRAAEETIRKMREGKGSEGKERRKERRDDDDENASASAGKARLVVRVPADARLWVDRVECPLPGTVRAFDTPDLNPQQSYSYTLRVAVRRGGQTVEDSRRVEFVAGQQVEIDFNNVGAVSTASR